MLVIHRRSWVSRGMTLAWNGPAAAATAAAAPQVSTNQNTSAWPLRFSRNNAGNMTTTQIRSLRKA